MPMSFPNMESLKNAAKIHKFRDPKPSELESDYRSALADHVRNIDLIESMEIRTGVGWDQFSPEQNEEMIRPVIERNRYTVK